MLVRDQSCSEPYWTNIIILSLFRSDLFSFRCFRYFIWAYPAPCTFACRHYLVPARHVVPSQWLWHHPTLPWCEGTCLVLQQSGLWRVKMGGPTAKLTIETAICWTNLSNYIRIYQIIVRLSTLTASRHLQPQFSSTIPKMEGCRKWGFGKVQSMPTPWMPGRQPCSALKADMVHWCCRAVDWHRMKGTSTGECMLYFLLLFPLDHIRLIRLDQSIDHQSWQILLFRLQAQRYLTCRNMSKLFEFEEMPQQWHIGAACGTVSRSRDLQIRSSEILGPSPWTPSGHQHPCCRGGADRWWSRWSVEVHQNSMPKFGPHSRKNSSKRDHQPSSTIINHHQTIKPSSHHQSEFVFFGICLCIFKAMLVPGSFPSLWRNGNIQWTQRGGRWLPGRTQAGAGAGTLQIEVYLSCHLYRNMLTHTHTHIYIYIYINIITSYTYAYIYYIYIYVCVCVWMGI